MLYMLASVILEGCAAQTFDCAPASQCLQPKARDAMVASDVPLSVLVSLWTVSSLTINLLLCMGRTGSAAGLGEGTAAGAMA